MRSKYSYQVKGLIALIMLFLGHHAAANNGPQEIYCTYEQFKFAATRTGSGEKVVLNFNTAQAKRFIVIDDANFSLQIGVVEMPLASQEINLLSELRQTNIDFEINYFINTFNTHFANLDGTNGCGGEGMDIPDSIRHGTWLSGACAAYLAFGCLCCS